MENMPPHLMDGGKTVMMSTKDYMKEHKNLIKILDKCGSPASMKEAMKQRKEVKSVLDPKGMMRKRNGTNNGMAGGMGDSY